MMLTSPQQIPNFRRLKVKVLQIFTNMFKIKNSDFFKASISIKRIEQKSRQQPNPRNEQQSLQI